MVRFVIILLSSILAITFLRSVIGLIMKTFAELTGSSRAREQPRGPAVPASGELKKDPVCGTYVSTATAFQATDSGATVYFCSAECKQKFAVRKA